MAGGRGTRLWPLSRQRKPKQFQCLASDKTMLQDTVDRLSGLFSKEDIYISTNNEYVDEVRKELPEISERQIISEPESRGTASSVALALATISVHDPRSVVAFFPSDHIVKKPDVLLRAISVAEEYIREHPQAIITFGIVPEYPETGYGYIHRIDPTLEDARHDAKKGIYAVSRFVEKPDAETARQYIADGHYFWNTAMYLFRADMMAEKFNRFLPDTFKRMLRLRDALESDDKEFPNVLLKEYPQMDKINFEYAIVENDTPNVAVMPLDIGWSDVGSWASLKDTVMGKTVKHFVKGEHVDFESENLLVYGSDKLIVTVGLKDLVIVDTEDAILICDRNKSQSVSNVVATLEKTNRKNKV